MQLHLVFVGKTALPEALIAVPRYLDRLGHYCRLKVHTVAAEKITRSADSAGLSERESRRVLDLVGADHPFLAWDERGQQLTSMGLAALLENFERAGVPRVWMALGGPLGFSEALRRRADRVLALSRLTFPHDLARVLVAEQLYRAFTILRREPYHK